MIDASGNDRTGRNLHMTTLFVECIFADRCAFLSRAWKEWCPEPVHKQKVGSGHQTKAVPIANASDVWNLLGRLNKSLGQEHAECEHRTMDQGFVTHKKLDISDASCLRNKVFMTVLVVTAYLDRLTLVLQHVPDIYIEVAHARKLLGMLERCHISKGSVQQIVCPRRGHALSKKEETIA